MWCGNSCQPWQPIHQARSWCFVRIKGQPTFSPSSSLRTPVAVTHRRFFAAADWSTLSAYHGTETGGESASLSIVCDETWRPASSPAETETCHHTRWLPHRRALGRGVSRSPLETTCADGRQIRRSMSQLKTSMRFPILRQEALGAFELGKAVAKIFYWIVLFWLRLQPATTSRSNCAKWFKPLAHAVKSCPCNCNLWQRAVAVCFCFV